MYRCWASAKLKDSRIWQFALENGYTIVSKDEDFHQMSLLLGHPTKFVYLRLGNCTTREVVQLLHSYEGRILDFCRDKEASLLVLA